MGRPSKEKVVEIGKIELPQDNSEIMIRLAILEDRVNALEAKKNEKPASVRSIQKVEDFNGEELPPKDEGKEGWSYQEQLNCMKNAAKILPPNLIKDGRHARENIEAICPFKVTEEMMDDLYAVFQHEV